MTEVIDVAGRAAVCSDKEATRAIEAYLGAQTASVRWYPMRKLHDLDRAVREGQVRHVLLGSLSDLLDGVWEHEIDLEAWLQRGVKIELVDASVAHGSTHIPHETVLTIAHAVSRKWQDWRARYQRRSRITAGVITAFVLGLCFVVNLLIAG